MPSVKIAIDIRRMTEFGVGTYIRNVVRTLERLDHETTYLLIGSTARIKEIGPLEPNFHAVPLAEPERSVMGFREFRTVVKRLECDLVHIPNLFSIPRALPCPYVMTVYDIPAGRIEVVYNAIDERLLRGHANPADRQLMVERYQVTYPFLLYAGRISPHKNVVRMIEAFSALKAELEKDHLFPDLKLIIIGDDVSGNPDLRRTVIRSGVQNDVRFLGFVPIEVLRTFYDAAKIFVFPSLYEGFGLPPLEAMAHGTPVVTSNVSSLPEVVGNAAVLVHPENVFEIMRALHRVLLDQPLREKMKERSYRQAARFSWEKSVQRIVEIYKEVLNGNAKARPHSGAKTTAGVA